MLTNAHVSKVAFCTFIFYVAQRGLNEKHHLTFWPVHYSVLDETPFLMVVRDSVIFGIPLDPADPSNNAMAPVSGISQGQDIDFDDREQLIYWVQNSVSGG